MANTGTSVSNIYRKNKIFVTKLGLISTLTVSYSCISTAPSTLTAMKNYHPSKAPHLPVMILSVSATYFFLNSAAKARVKRGGRRAIRGIHLVC